MIRSARLHLKGTGAPLPSNVQFKGAPVPTNPTDILQMTFSCRWRDKTYGKIYINDLYFDVQTQPSGPFFTFWRNWVFIGPVLYFGNMYSTSQIQARGNDAYLVLQSCFTPTREYKLGGSFNQIKTAFERALVPTEHVVDEYKIYRFPTEGEGSITVVFSSFT
jgi:hypothetical protein